VERIIIEFFKQYITIKNYHFDTQESIKFETLFEIRIPFFATTHWRCPIEGLSERRFAGYPLYGCDSSNFRNVFSLGLAVARLTMMMAAKANMKPGNSS